jgi:uncharacterized SAM-binding protein YcdF (DUF218 family)
MRFVALAVLTVIVIMAITVAQVVMLGRDDDRRHSDVLIVLGASQYNGRPSAIFAARLDHARDLYDAGVASRIITVGGAQIGDAYTEGDAGASYLVARGVPRSAVFPVGVGNDTLTSLRAIGPMLTQHKWRTAVVVTDPWHSLRSRAIARDLGINAVTSPVTAGPSTRGFITQTRYILRESIGYRYYQLFHRATPAGAAPPAA